MAIQLVKKNQDKEENQIFKRRIIGYDINQKRINELKNGFDNTNEIDNKDLKLLDKIELTSENIKLLDSEVFIVTVPTPIDKNNKPNLDPLKSACILVGDVLKKKKERNNNLASIVIFESTVYPGTTEEICAEIIKKESGLEYNHDFYCGYSPERINPGDKSRKISNIVKVTSGSDKESSVWVDKFYSSFIDAGTHMTSSIKIAEAAKIIENTQRDLNIALINELSIIFKKMNVDTQDVLSAASTKWNFLPFKPGLVGGHCIGVDPYYLTFKSEELGYTPKVILSGRKLNDGMANWVADELILKLEQIKSKNNNILVLGFTFKVNCPDIRNTQVIKLIRKIQSIQNRYNVDIVDNLANKNDVFSKYSVNISNKIPTDKKYIAVILAVAHDHIKEFVENKIESLIDKDGLIIDLDGSVPRSLNPWRL